MILCAAGDIHGALDRMFTDILAFETALSVCFDWVLNVGDLGVWPDPARIDGATRRHEGAGDFPAWWADGRAAPRPTMFIKGNHEDFVWLDAQPTAEVLPGLHYLRNGRVRELRAANETLRVGRIGGCFGPSDFERHSASLQGYAKRHYTRDEIDALAAQDGLDIVLTHDAPSGVAFERHRRGAGYTSEATGLGQLLARTQPRVCLFGHHHSRPDSTVAGVPLPRAQQEPSPRLPRRHRDARRSARMAGPWRVAPAGAAAMKTPRRKESKRVPRRKSAAAEPSTHEDPDAGIDALAERLAPLVRQIQALQEQARSLGLFANDRELLACPNCGLVEDVLAGGQLITNYGVGEPDTGMRFLEPESDDGPFGCPECGGEVYPEET